MGIPGVILASVIILGFGQDPQLKLLKYIVLFVVLYTSITMLIAGFRSRQTAVGSEQLADKKFR